MSVLTNTVQLYIFYNAIDNRLQRMERKIETLIVGGQTWQQKQDKAQK